MVQGLLRTSAPLDSMEVAMEAAATPKKKRGKTAKVMQARKQHDGVQRDKHGNPLDSSGKRIRASREKEKRNGSSNRHKLDESGQRARAPGAEQMRMKRRGSRHKKDFGQRMQGVASDLPRCPWGHALVISCGACAHDKGVGEDTRRGMLLDCPRCDYAAIYDCQRCQGHRAESEAAAEAPVRELLAESSDDKSEAKSTAVAAAAPSAASPKAAVCSRALKPGPLSQGPQQQQTAATTATVATATAIKT